MSSDRILVLAVTRMLSGMCTAGISQATGKWVRPVKEHGTLLPGDLTYRDRTPIKPFDIVTFSLIKPRPQPPHIEDWTCDFIRARPVKSGQVNERLRALERYTEPDVPALVMEARRSLGMFEPSEVEAIFTWDSYTGKYEARLRTAETGDRPIPITDIKWRALGRILLDGRERLTLSGGEISECTGAERLFVALGLGRMYEGRHWPLVIGVHTWPDYEVEIDYKNL